MSKLDYTDFLVGDVKEKIKEIPDNSVHVCITSPPYWNLRDYNRHGQLGLEDTPIQYVSNLVDVFEEVKRVLHPSGTLWVNVGDNYNGSGGTGTQPNLRPSQKNHNAPPTRFDGLKEKDLCMIPSRLAIALQDAGWWLRSEIVWAKGISFCNSYSGSCMPESVRDRPTNSHENLYMFSKSKRYFYDIDAIKEGVTTTSPGRNLRSVWTINPSSYKGAHFAVFPVGLVEPCIKAGTSNYGVCSQCKSPYFPVGVEYRKSCSCNASVERATVLDPFMGSGTTAIAALKHGRQFIGIELNEEYVEMARKRILNHKSVPVNHKWWK